MRTLYLGLGSNLGDRRRHLEDALERLGAAGIEVVRRSSIYETEPRGFSAQPWFLNLVVEARTELFPRQVLERTARIEADLGRRRGGPPNGPRIIDIDILLFGGFVIDTPELTVPHPRMAERRFVLEPLAELAPELCHPLLRTPIRELLAATADQPVRKLRPPE